MEIQEKAVLFESSEEWAGFERSMLERLNIQVVDWYKRGTGWLSSAQGHHPTLAIIDYVLPGKDGFYCVEKLLEMDPLTKIIMTHPFEGAYANYIEMRAINSGLLAVIPKPFGEKRFYASLQRALRVGNAVTSVVNVSKSLK